MKRMLMIGLVTVAVGSIYSSVYACDHSRKNVNTTAGHQTKIIRTFVVDATTGCKSIDKSQVMTFDFEVPSKVAPAFVHRIEREKAEMESPSPLRTAVTLGKAFMTTIGAVVSSLLGVVSDLTAGLV